MEASTEGAFQAPPTPPPSPPATPRAEEQSSPAPAGYELPSWEPESALLLRAADEEQQSTSRDNGMFSEADVANKRLAGLRADTFDLLLQAPSARSPVAASGEGPRRVDPWRTGDTPDDPPCATAETHACAHTATPTAAHLLLALVSP